MSNFSAPEICVGEPCQFFVFPGSEPEAAICTWVSTDGKIVNLMSFDKSGYSMTPHEGCRHVDDPLRDTALRANNGLWGKLPSLSKNRLSDAAESEPAVATAD